MLTKVVNQLKRFIKMLKARFMHKIKQPKWMVFYALILLGFLNGFIMTLYRIDNDYEYKVLNHAYIEAVLPGQDLDQTLITGIVRTTDIRVESLEVGDSVVICCDFDIDVPWVQSITDLNPSDGLMSVTYDGSSAITIGSEQVYGRYVREANFIGTIYYTASYPLGYIYLIIIHVLIIGGYYFVFLFDDANRFVPDKIRKKYKKDARD